VPGGVADQELDSRRAGEDEARRQTCHADGCRSSSDHRGRCPMFTTIRHRRNRRPRLSRPLKAHHPGRGGRRHRLSVDEQAPQERLLRAEDFRQSWLRVRSRLRSGRCLHGRAPASARRARGRTCRRGEYGVGAARAGVSGDLCRDYPEAGGRPPAQSSQGTLRHAACASDHQV